MASIARSRPSSSVEHLSAMSSACADSSAATSRKLPSPGPGSLPRRMRSHSSSSRAGAPTKWPSGLCNPVTKAQARLPQALDARTRPLASSSALSASGTNWPPVLTSKRKQSALHASCLPTTAAMSSCRESSPMDSRRRRRLRPAGASSGKDATIAAPTSSTVAWKASAGSATSTPGTQASLSTTPPMEPRSEILGMRTP
mmetsp:Transcript_2254/g.5721  ORF Transcript_2254/g.5721 Transcript_2254/m.5721 type:complete len:200 (-) Transcript_2254:86-685(-)